MKTREFKSWLASRKPFDSGTVNARVANALRVERFHGNLDDVHANGEFGGLIRQFDYSTDDQRCGARAKHKVPIKGDVRNGSATLKSALVLYDEFLAHYGRGGLLPAPVQPASAPQSAPQATPKPLPKPTPKDADWPRWNEPTDTEALQLAKVLVPYVRFLCPDIVRALVNDNEKRGQTWREVLGAAKIDPDAYLWPGSPCAFAGVRRYAGSEEIAIYRKHKSAANEGPPPGALALDDNDFPKQLWSYVLRGKPFQKFGPEGYSLAHLADHKDHQNRAPADFALSPASIGVSRRLYGLYTCPTNTVYVPRSFLKPTDFNGKIRQLLIRRAQELYGSFCSIVPPFMQVRSELDLDWHVEQFEWAAPVGETTHVPAFLEFRSKKLADLARSAFMSSGST